MNRLFVSAAHKSSGKTTISLGLCAALRARGMAVQAFKKGPDYIDPMWLGQATGAPCHNLDFFTMEPGEILATVARYGTDSDIAVIEGNKGLYDGLDLDGSNSNAALARLLDTPVILVIDARGMTRGIAPLVLGYQAFDPAIRIGGVILNRLGGRRHESKLRAVIEHYTDIPVIGAVHNDTRLQLVERHLGLMPSNEDAGAAHRIGQIGEAVGSQVDLDAVVRLAATAGALQTPGASARAATARERDVRIGVARDAAFGFYYPGDLEALEQAGAELVPIDTLHDRRLPALDGLFIGGGFPETSMESLQANSELRAAIRGAVESGLPVYAECGGLMYLARSLSWKGRTCEMVGAIPADVQMHERPQGRGYIRLEETAAAPWPGAGGAPGEIAGHEFHYSTLENLAPGQRFAYRVLRGTGIDGQHDGIVVHNTLACYAHLRDTGRYHWAARFVSFVRDNKNASALHASAGPG